MSDDYPGILAQYAAVKKEAEDYVDELTEADAEDVERLIALLFRWFIRGIIRGQESIEGRLGLEAKG